MKETKQGKTYKVNKNKEWIEVTSPEQIKKGDLFRMFDKNGKIINDTSIFRNIFSAEKDAYLDKKGKIFVEYCTDWGNIIVDDEINAHRICNKCGNIQKLRTQTMDALDDLTLDQLDKMVLSFPNKNRSTKKEEHTQEENPKCDKCGGELFVVSPIVEFEGKTLLECVDCHERIYLCIEILDESAK